MGEMIDILDGSASGYLEGADGAKGIVVLQEWWGLVPHIKDICGRLAGEGYQTLAPDLYHGKSTVEAEEANHLALVHFQTHIVDHSLLAERFRERPSPKNLHYFGRGFEA